MAKQKTKNGSKEKVLYPRFRLSKIISAAIISCAALFMLSLTIVKLKAFLEGEILGWEASWWLAALCFLMYILLLASSLKEIFFVRLVLSKEGIWYYQIGNKKYIPWEQVERVGVTRSYINGKTQYGLILKSSASNENKRTFFAKQQVNQVIPLSMFVDEWFVSELREEIKRLNPLLSIQ